MNQNVNSIAIVGMACRYPDVENVESFWQALLEKKELLTKLSNEELRLDIHHKEKNFVNSASILNHYDSFDYEFFGYSKNEALNMDPQQRVFLEECWHALEHAGYNPAKMSGDVGVYGSISYPKYLIQHLENHPDLVAKRGYHEMLLGNDKDYVATRVSYKLNLHGPSFTVQTACSSSLVAVHLACQSLLTGDSDCALAGAACISVPHKVGYVYEPSMIFSKDGHCRPFDHKSSGTVFGSGVGIVVLKRLEDAIKDNDTIYSVIRATAINNDGNLKIGMTAPSMEQQAAVLKSCLKKSKVSPETISYLEAHGTGTELGDMIELEAVKQAYGLDSEKSKKHQCAIGSVKSNLGHMDVASGVTGLIKATLALYHQRIPATLHFEKLNPRLNLDDTRFFIQSDESKWESQDGVLRAAVSSFGVGGTNAHAILENYPVDALRSINTHEDETYIVKVSAKNENVLDELSKQITQDLKTYDLRNLTYTLNSGRNDFEFKRVLLISKENGEISFENLNFSAKNKKLVLLLDENFNTNSQELLKLYEEYPLLSKVRSELENLFLTRLNLNLSSASATEATKYCVGLLHQFVVIKALVQLGQTSISLAVGNDVIQLKKIDDVLLKLMSMAGAGQKLGASCKTDATNYEFKFSEFGSLPVKVFLQWLGVCWLSGTKIKWDNLYTEKGAKRIAAPLYPFVRNSLILTEHLKSEVGLWSSDYVLVSDIKQRTASNGKIFTVASDSNIKEQFLIIAKNGQHFNTISDLIRELPNIEEMRETSLDLFVHLPSVLAEASFENDYFSILELVKKVGSLGKDVYLNFIIESEQTSYPFYSSMLGTITSLALEISQIRFKWVEFDEIHSLFFKLREINAYKVQIKDHEVFKETFTKLNTETKKELPENGVYVVIGGLGNVGLLFANEIAMRKKSHFILSSRNVYKNDEQVKKQIAKLQELGSSLELVSCDITSLEDVRRLFGDVSKKHAQITGVINCAGLVGKANHYLNNIGMEDVTNFFASKINGTKNVLQVLKEKDFGFYWSTSSTTTVLGGMGDALYSAANSVQKELVHKFALTKKSSRVVSIDLDYMPRIIDDVGIPSSKNFAKTLFEYALSFEDFSQLFERMLVLESQVVSISKGNLNKRLSDIFELSNSVRTPVTASESSAVVNELSLAQVDKAIEEVWCQVLGSENYNPHENFFDAGGSSFLGIGLINKLNSKLSTKLHYVDLYNAPTANLLKEQVLKSTASNKVKKSSTTQQTSLQDIAVVGMSGAFPGANSTEELWDNLMSSKSGIVEFSDQGKWQDFAYVSRRGILADVDKFDYRFFGMSKKEADLTDPQHRFFLQHAWKALEDAGLVPDQIKATVGVFASTCISTYLSGRFFSDDLNPLETQTAVINNSPDSIATRLSYKLNLKGPSKTIQTFCSSSLVALEDAILNIKSGKCDIAVVGGVSIITPQEQGYYFDDSLMYSQSGNLSPFDKNADGTVFSNGIGVVVLKRLDLAEESNDQIYGVIKGISINNDGSKKVSYYAPSVEGQQKCIAGAYDQSQLSPDDIHYIEAHGTGTKVGDMIEFESLKQVFGERTNIPKCYLGTIKGNIGHLDRASGITGLIKALLVVNKKLIPPTINFEEANEHINLTQSPFLINTSPVQFESESPMRAAVSSLGVGGTNVHLVVEGRESKKVSREFKNEDEFFIFSAHSETSLKQMLVKMSHFLERNPEVDLHNLSYTLSCCRKEFKYRKAIVAKDVQELIQLLTSESQQRKSKWNDLLNDWMGAKEINFESHFNLNEVMKLRLPTYEFEKISCWYEMPKVVADFEMASMNLVDQVEFLENRFMHHLDNLKFD